VGQGHDLVVLGDLVADLIVPVERLPPVPDKLNWAEGIFVEPGGAGNVLVAATRMNLTTAALASLGPDRYGADVLAMLAAEGVDVSHVAIHEQRQTVLCIVLADTVGQHVYLGVKDGLGLWPFPERWHALIRGARALYTDGYSLLDLLAPADMLAACATARAAGTSVFFDPGPSVELIPRPILEQAIAAADTLLLSEAEAAHLSDVRTRAEVARALLALGPTTIVMKLGGEGCLIATAGDVIHVPAFPVDVVDTVGAGDSFAAAWIAGWLRGGSPRDCAVLANAMGALTSTQRGAGTRIPPRARLLELLAEYPAALALTG
jgi:2-dehydro-3-deoxygluconokinase